MAQKASGEASGPFFIGDDVYMENKRIVIDPGHGGEDNGAAWGHAEEDDINLHVAYLLRCELEKSGCEVRLTRERDEAVALIDRVGYANRSKASLFVSIHCDAFHKTTAKGISTHVYLGGSQLSYVTGERIQEALMERFPDHVNRGVKLSNFYVLRNTIMPAVLVECEFLSNPEMRLFLREPENQLAIAQAIASGLVVVD